MSQPNPFSAAPANDWPVRFQFPVTWSCLAAPFNRFEQFTVQRTPVAYEAPTLAGQEALPHAAPPIADGEEGLAPEHAGTHWEMVVPKMSRPSVTPAARSGPVAIPGAPAVGPLGEGRLGTLSFPRSHPASLVSVQEQALFGSVTPESAARALAGRLWNTVRGIRLTGVLASATGTLRAIPAHVRGYALGAALAGIGVWVWLMYVGEPSGHWLRAQTPAGPSAPMGRQLVLYRPATQTAVERMEFEWTADDRAVGVVLRAAGGATHNSYYGVRISPVPAPVTTALIAERFAVIDGVEGPRIRKLIPLIGNASKIDVRVEGDHAAFHRYLQGSLADTWNDNRIPSGGLGFYYEQEGLPSVRAVRLSFPGAGGSDYAGIFSALIRDLK